MPTTLTDAVIAYVKRFGSLEVSHITLGDDTDLGKRLIREINEALESGKRMNEDAFERDLQATLPAGAKL